MATSDAEDRIVGAMWHGGVPAEVGRSLLDRILAARSADMEARIRALHYRCGPDHMSAVGYCHECIVEWPCPTVALLGVAPAGGAE